MPTRRSLLTTQLDRLGRSKVTELCSRTGTELDLADQTLVVVSISTPVGQIPFSVPQIASRLTRCACCLALRLDRTSLDIRSWIQRSMGIASFFWHPEHFLGRSYRHQAVTLPTSRYLLFNATVTLTLMLLIQTQSLESHR